MATAQLLNIPQFLGPDYASYTYTFYEPSTTTAKNAYTTSVGSVALSNPLTLNSNGSTTTGIWGTGFYRVILKDTSGTTVFDWDNVSGGEATTLAVSGSGVADPYSNLIRNSQFTVWTAIDSGATVADAGDSSDNWYVLTQSGNTTTTQLTSTGDARFSSANRVTNTHGSAQRIGICQFTDINRTPAIVGNTVQFGVSVSSSVTATVNVALLAGITVTNLSRLKDIVNTWTNPSFTIGQFFANDATIQVIATTSASVSSGTWSTITSSGTIPSNCTGVYLFVWTNDTHANAAYIDVSGAYVQESTTAITWRPNSGGDDIGETLFKIRPTNFLVQRTLTQSTTTATGTTQVPGDTTIPQNTEGDEYLTASITPKSTTNILVITACLNIFNDTSGGYIAVALFQDSTANALATSAQPIAAIGDGGPVFVRYTMAAGTTSSTTFKIRAGKSASGTNGVNRDPTGAITYGGIMTSSLQIDEYTP